MSPNNFWYNKCTAASFYRMWVEMLTPYHKLTSREKDVAARLLMQYFRFKENVPDPDVLNELLWSTSSRRDMMASLKMSHAHFQMVLAKLRTSGFLNKDGSIYERYIPHKRDGEPRLMLQVVFDWSSPENPVKDVS